jgi:type II secretory pathway component PulM
MTTIVSEFKESPLMILGFEKALLFYLRYHGDITSLDKFAHEIGMTPCHVNRCVHAAAKKGLVKMTRLTNIQGQPYQVTLQEETK